MCDLRPARSIASQRLRRYGRCWRRDEAGSALPFVLLIGAALLSVAAWSLSVGIGSRSAATHQMHSKSAFFCAQRGLERARPIIVASQPEWNKVLSGTAVAWHPITGFCPGAGGYSYRVTIRDNADDADQASDSDRRIIADAEAVRGTEVAARLSALIEMPSQDVAPDYSAQSGLGAQKMNNR